jgi:hypothetical protein
MMKRIISIALALTLFPLVSLAQSKSDLSVTLPNGTTVTLTNEKLLALPRTSETATSHGKTHTYEGSNLRDVLQAAGVDEIKSLRGPLLRRVVVAEGSDGYRAVFALSELDTTIGDKQVLVVNHEDGKELSTDDGPWRIVVASDKRPARWVRQITRFVVTDIP